MKMDPESDPVPVEVVAAQEGPAPKAPPPIVGPPAPISIDFSKGNGEMAISLGNHIRALKAECNRLKQQLFMTKNDHEKKMAEFEKEEKEIKEENLRLQRRLQLEMERREALCRWVTNRELTCSNLFSKIWNF